MQINYIRHYSAETNLGMSDGAFDDLPLADRLGLDMSLGLIEPLQTVDSRVNDGDLILSSEHQRAQQTALSVAGRIDELNQSLNERRMGVATLLSKSALNSIDEWRLGRQSDPVGWRPEGGESFLDVVHRIEEFKKYLHEDYEPNCRIFCFSHETVMRAVQYDMYVSRGGLKVNHFIAMCRNEGTLDHGAILRLKE